MLNWREEKRRARQRRLLALLLAGGVMAVGLQITLGVYLDKQYVLQQQRNQYLASYTLQLSEQLNQLQMLEQTHQALQSRLNLVQALQVERNRTTNIMNLLPQMIPAGVYLDQVKMNDGHIQLEGISESTSLLAIMLQSLEASPLVTNIEMHSIVDGTVRFARNYQAYKVAFTLRGENDGTD
ncbi:PilN domain-containing protein [Vibrio galatheae]|uniref:PilN domain-containing protein n=1 Tax=Vibrio galatheae TaxID=579748 RepID=UPI000A419F8A|nr:PilN domain-containing protein [Vibrio galatheae]